MDRYLFNPTCVFNLLSPLLSRNQRLKMRRHTLSVRFQPGEEAECIYRLTHRHIAARQHLAPGGTRRAHQLRLLRQVDDVRNPQAFTQRPGIQCRLAKRHTRMHVHAHRGCVHQTLSLQ